MENRILALVNKARMLEEAGPISQEDLEKVRAELGVKFSKDFLDLAAEYHFEFLSFFDWCGLSTGCIEYTNELRAEGLPRQYVVLAGFRDDGGSVFLETTGDEKQSSRVIWCDMADVYNLCSSGSLKHPCKMWTSFTDFFGYLVAKEEELKKSELKN